MPRIGLRELKIHLSEVIRHVQDEGARYTVTNHGTPAAVIVPYSDTEAKRPMSPDELTALLDDLTRQVDGLCPEPWSVADTIDDLR